MDKVWFKNYQPGVPHEINMDESPSLVDLFLNSCKKHSELTAYVNFGSSLSYHQVEQLSRHFAAYLQQLGLVKGDRVAIMMPNVLQYPVLLFAILRAGFVVVNTNPLYTIDEVYFQMKDSGTKAIIVLANFAHTIEKVLPKLTEVKHVIVTEIGDLFSPFKRVLFNAVVKYIKHMVPKYHIENSVPLRKGLQLGKKAAFTPSSLHHEDIAFLQYTGGTTGIAKGAILTHGNMVANILQATAWINPLSLGAHDTIVTAIPLYHIFSLTANCLTFFNAGAKNILITNPRDLPQFIHAIRKAQFTAITGVNTLFNLLLNYPKFADVDFSKLKLALSGGMALQKSVAIQWQKVTKSPVLEAYGLTETSPAVTINPLCLREYNGSIGLPLPSTDVSIRNDEGQEVSLGERGELCVKGPQVTPGYWQHPEETAHIFSKDGYLHTGDIAIMDQEGFIYLVDRKKDMILISGFNVYPTEIEQIISMLPGVLEVGVLGIKDQNGVEHIKACIVKRDPALTAEEVIQHCRQHLTAYKVPKLIGFYNELPKTNVGKILRRALKDLDH